MAGDLNKVMLLGRLTRDPEIRQLSSGTSLCRFSIANNRIYTQNGEKKEEVSFFNCTAWGRQGEIIQQYCHKGKQVAIEGHLRQNSWEDNEGKKNSSIDIVVDQCQFLGPINGAKSSNDGQGMSQETEAMTKSTPSSLPNKMEDDDIPF